MLLPTPSALLQSAASAPLNAQPQSLGGFGSAGNLQRAVSRKLSGWRNSTQKAAAAAAAVVAAQSSVDTLGSSPTASSMQAPPQQQLPQRTALILRNVSAALTISFLQGSRIHFVTGHAFQLHLRSA